MAGVTGERAAPTAEVALLGGAETTRPTDATLIGSPGPRATAKKTTKVEASPVQQKSDGPSHTSERSFWARLPWLILAACAAGACMIGFHFHMSVIDHNAQLRAEVKRLQDHSQKLEERATLATKEQQDLARLVLDPRAKKRMSRMMERSRAFDNFIQRNGFANDPSNTNEVRECLGQALFELNVKSMLDVPCGDGSWQHLIPGIQNITYVGADISMRALERAKHLADNQASEMEFMIFDAVHFPLKRNFDLVLYRGAIEQQPVQDSLQAILNFKKSGSKYIAASFWPESPPEANEAAHTLQQAGWYEANLLEAPFKFPAPVASCENSDPGSPHRGKVHLGIWRLKDLPVTVGSVRQASPELHPHMFAKLSNNLPGVHFPVLQMLPQDRPHEPGQQLRDMDLENLMKAFGGAFAPERQRMRQTDLERIADPFDGLFSNWLQTSGPVNRGLPSRRSRLPTEFFSIPGFVPDGQLRR